MQQIEAQISGGDAEVSQVPTGSVQELLSIWEPRLENSIQAQFVIPGLSHLVHNLQNMSKDDRVDQFNVLTRDQTGVVFFSTDSDRVLGAIVTTRSEAQRRRSLTNFLAANGGSMEDEPLSLDRAIAPGR